MSGQYDNTDRGCLFRNDDKQSDRHPDYTGTINVGGNEYFLSAWLKTAKSGRKFMSLSVKLKDAPRRTQQARSTRPEPTTDDEFNDSIPF